MKMAGLKQRNAVQLFHHVIYLGTQFLLFFTL